MTVKLLFVNASLFFPAQSYSNSNHKDFKEFKLIFKERYVQILVALSLDANTNLYFFIEIKRNFINCLPLKPKNGKITLKKNTFCLSLLSNL